MNLIWFRNDLRLADNPAFHSAMSRKEPCRAVYVACPDQWQEHGDSPAKIGLQSGLLADLKQRLAKKHVPLDLLECHHFADVPETLKNYCLNWDLQRVYWNQEVPVNEQARDKAVTDLLKKQHIDVSRHQADLLVVPETLLTQQDTPFKVFTPWYRQWLTQLQDDVLNPLPVPRAAPDHWSDVDEESTLTLPGSGDFRDDIWPATEKAAQKSLKDFAEHRANTYLDARDYPGIKGTSLLSPYLTVGAISARQCAQAAAQQARENGNEWRQDPWIREVAWREFYRYLMVHFPRLCREQPFRLETKAIPWSNNRHHQRAWEEGRTGFPIVDAAMRQLLQTGWMHNRLRMVTASFYTKLLFLDWHQGESFFMNHLIDGDFASNNGGWQWSASTGCDAQPWFRIFNPESQSKKYDAEGKFIRRFLPELESLSDKQIHTPTSEQRRKLDYPQPIIDYREARATALETFKATLGSQSDD